MLLITPNYRTPDLYINSQDVPDWLKVSQLRSLGILAIHVVANAIRTGIDKDCG